VSKQGKFTVGLVQMAPRENPVASLERAIGACEEAAVAGAQVICLPELFRTPYFCRREDETAFDLAEPVPGPTTEALGAVARRTGAVILAPVFERRTAGVYHNSVAVLDADGSLAGVYRKMHVPDDPGFHEKFYFTPGDLGFPTFKTAHGSVAPLICWDQWYPEAARLATLGGAAILFYPSAIGWLPAEKEAEGQTQYDAWGTVQRAHAIANGVYVAAVNRIGHETSPGEGQGIEFWGGSFLCDPRGIVVAQASHGGEEILLGEVDLDRIEATRRGWPFLRDRRIDAYDGLTRRLLDDRG